MIYPYFCRNCEHEWEVIKSYRDIDNPESCPDCGSLESNRTIAVSQSFSGESDWDTAHYSPALGKVVKNYAEERAEAKRLGLTEVGTEPLDKIHKKFDNDRAEKLQSAYDSINMDHGDIKSSRYSK